MGYTNLEWSGLVLSTALVCYILKKVWILLYIFLIGPVINKVDVKSYGRWALITGSTDGIGKEYARQLAARGCNIILVSRSMEKLKSVALEIEKEFNVQTKVIQIDFGGDLTIYDKLKKEIEDLEIGILINNVGISYAYPEYFLDVENWDSFMTDLVNINIVSVIRVTGIILPAMLKRGKGIIVNVSSISYIVTSPMLSAYAGTKAFVTKFTEDLRQEYANKGILFQCIAPGVVATSMSHNCRTSFFIPDAKTYVSSALGLLGTAHVTYGYINHFIMALIYNTLGMISEKLPVALSIKMFTKTKMKEIRKRKAKQ